MSNIDQHDGDGMKDMDAVSRAYRGAGDADGMAPSAALDDAIRAAAHRAVHSGPKLAGSSWIRRWTPQLAVAAVVVLSVSVVFVSIEERPDLAPASVQKIALNQSAEPPAEAPPPVQTRIVEPAPVPKPAFDAVKKKADAVAADTQVLAQLDAALQKAERGSASNTLPSAPPPPSQAAAAPAPAAPVYTPPARPALAPAAPAAVATNIAPAPFPATVADAVAPARKEARADENYAVVPEAKPVEERVAVAGTVRSKDVYTASALAAARVAQSAATTASPVAAGQAPMAKQLAAAAAPASGVAATTLPAPAAEAVRGNAQATASGGIRAFSKDEVKSAGKPDDDERPGPWLKRLLELREQNKFKELREQLVRFRKAHPDVVLPKVLTELPPE